MELKEIKEKIRILRGNLALASGSNRTGYDIANDAIEYIDKHLKLEEI